MTTICTDGRAIAADSRATRGNEIAVWQETKIIVRHGRIYASTGAAAMTEPLIAWHSSGADPEKLPKWDAEVGWSLLVVDRDGMTVFEKCAHGFRVEAPYTLGSGREWAMGAMLAGASPHRALEIACKMDVWSGPPIQVIDIAEALGLDQKLQAAE